MKRLTLPVILALLSAALVPASPATAATDTRIGLLLPYSGVYAALGQEIDAGFRIGLEDPENAGLNITVITGDTEVSPATALARIRKLVLQDRVNVLAGIVSSGVLDAIRDFVHNSKIPLVVANAGNDRATGERCSPWIIRISFSNSQIVGPMGKWLFDRGVRRVYTLAPDYAAGHQMIGTFSERFTAAGGTIAGGAFTPFRKTRDFGPWLTAAAASGANAIFSFYSGSEAVAFVRQYGDFGLHQILPLHGPGWLVSPSTISGTGDAAIGLTTILNYFPSLDTPENRRFSALWTAKTGRMPSEFAVQGFDAARLITAALRKTGSNDSETLRRALVTTPLESPRGQLRIDPATNNVIQSLHIATTAQENGRIVYRIIDTIPDVQDAPGGCVMPS